MTSSYFNTDYYCFPWSPLIKRGRYSRLPLTCYHRLYFQDYWTNRQNYRQLHCHSEVHCFLYQSFSDQPISSSATSFSSTSAFNNLRRDGSHPHKAVWVSLNYQCSTVHHYLRYLSYYKVHQPPPLNGWSTQLPFTCRYGHPIEYSIAAFLSQDQVQL